MRDTKKGYLFVVSGPSGAGKGAICAGLEAASNVVLSVSMTTRAPRAQEQEGKSYYFVDEERFRAAIAEDGFFEYAAVHDEYYGTPKAPVLEQLEKGKDIVLEIDPQGAMQVRAKTPESILIFIMPPSFAELKKRIERRGSETPESMKRRLDQAEKEIAQLGKYDYCVVNDVLESAIKDVLAIIRSEKLLDTDRATQFLPVADLLALRRAGKLRVGTQTEKILKRYLTGG